MMNTLASAPAGAVLLLLALNAVLVMLLWRWLATRPRDDAGRASIERMERMERALRDELGRQGQATRSDLGNFQRMLLTQSGDVARTQNEQIDSFRTQLATMQQQTDAALRRFSDTLAEQLRLLSDATERRQTELRQAVDTRLVALQEGNEKKLEQMRATVDEKLQATLEQRLGESFKQVAERLEQVHKGLGEMQSLARDVGSLNRVLSNVKTRGVFGEVQLASLLEQVFTPEQYATQVATVPGSNDRVDFAIRLPGRGHSGSHGGSHSGSDSGAVPAPLWLPIDAKFPREDYDRLLDAHERADAPAMEVSAKAIEVQIRKEARSIRDKYVAPPHTTDFAILFLATEGLYAEALRRPGLSEALQRDFKVMLAGPTTLLATLNSLQMGFRTLAIQQRSSEVWKVLGTVKSEFGRFAEVLANTKRQLQTVANTIDQAEVRTRQIERKLKDVEVLPGAEAVQEDLELEEKPIAAIRPVGK